MKILKDKNYLDISKTKYFGEKPEVANVYLKKNSQNGLEKIIEKTINFENIPKYISGQRSLTIEFEGSYYQIKGVVYRGNEKANFLSAPKMVAYTGRGHPENSLFLTENGCEFNCSKKIPCGTLSYESAKLEFDTLSILHDKKIPVVEPIGYGKLKDLKFNNQETGFVVTKIHSLENFRLDSQLIDIWNKSQTGKIEKIEKIYSDYGKLLSDFHKNGYIHGHPHLNNISINEKGNLIFHDIAGDNGEFLKRENLNKKQFLQQVLFDLTNVSEPLLQKFDTKKELKSLKNSLSKQKLNKISYSLQVCESLKEIGNKSNLNFLNIFFNSYFDKDKQLPKNYFDKKETSDLTTLLLDLQDGKVSTEYKPIMDNLLYKYNL